MAGLLEAVQQMVASKADREEVQGLRRTLGDKVNLADHQVGLPTHTHPGPVTMWSTHKWPVQPHLHYVSTSHPHVSWACSHDGPCALSQNNEMICHRF